MSIFVICLEILFYQLMGWTSFWIFLFRWKTFCKDSALDFPMFGSIKKIGQQKTIFDQWKTSSFSLSQRNPYKYSLLFAMGNNNWFGALSLFHDKHSQIFFSLPFTFSLFSVLMPTLSLSSLWSLPKILHGL